MSSVTCHLARGDGSRWIVTSYRRERGVATVCAVRELELRGEGGSNGEGGGEESGGAGPAAGRGGAGARSLWRARLEEGDRLEWRGPDGRLLASSTGRDGGS